MATCLIWHLQLKVEMGQLPLTAATWLRHSPSPNRLCRFMWPHDDKTPTNHSSVPSLKAYCSLERERTKRPYSGI